MPSQIPTIISIIPSDSEISSGELSQKNLERALTAIHCDGIVVIENVVSIPHIDAVNAVMIKDSKKIFEANDPVMHNEHRYNLRQDPPVNDELFFEDIYLNSFVLQVCNARLGPRPKMLFLSSNAAMPQSTFKQHVHSDGKFEHPPIPWSLIVNVPLVHTSAANGSTEFWMGSHYVDDPYRTVQKLPGPIPLDVLEARKEISPPLQPVLKKGSVMIRDPRLWHAGTPNPSDEIRILLAMIFFAPWYRNEMKIVLPKDGEVEKRVMKVNDRLEIPVRWVEGEVDHVAETRARKHNWLQTD